ncbi:NAD-dependent epimerase/dehydratase family protein [Paenibacillus dendritiformis]|uniref:NAD-dependent epimerase/dehydratase family protein n=1 Tax=Paenibacillus dendritiformis TaxID=130049 RepID=UPI00365870B2
MTTILVTGGSGWIGGFVVGRLLRMGYDVHAAYRTVPCTDLGCTWHRADLLDAAEVQALMERIKPSHLMHLAWEAVPPQCYYSLRNYSWARAGKELIRQFVRCGGRRVIVSGTCAEYEWVDGYLSEEGSALSMKNPYAACKHSLRTWLQSDTEVMGVSSGWARIFHLYGPREAGNRLVSAIIRALLVGKEALCTHGRQYRDYLYVKDVAAALVAMLFSDVQGTVNIGSGKPIQVKELASLVARRLGGARRIRFGAIPYTDDEPLFIGANIERLEREVQWKPAYTLEAGIEETIAWWRNVMS